jgi:hypothetical protein
MQTSSEFFDRIKHFITAVVLLCLFAAAAQNGYAQFETASVLGYVRDSAGNVIAGSSVQLLNTATGVIVKVKTDSQGQYQFTDVHIGQYKIDARYAGFTETSTDGSFGSVTSFLPPRQLQVAAKLIF